MMLYRQTCSYLGAGTHLSFAMAALLASTQICFAQAPAQPPEAKPATPAPSSATTSAAGSSQTLSSRLGVYVFPGKGQTASAQTLDEKACFDWAKTQTGIDPLAAQPAAASAQEPQSTEKKASNAGEGERVKGAARGAAAGAAIGAVAGDAGDGAAIGATAGALRGGREKREAQAKAQAEQQQQQQSAAEQAKSAASESKATYNKAFSACLEAKGYTVK